MKPNKEQAELAYDLVFQAARAALLSANQHEEIKMALNALKALVEETYKEVKE